MKLRRRILVPLVAGVVALAASTLPARADLGIVPPGYEIEAKTLYCGPQDVPCIPFAQDTFTDVTAWNFQNVTSGTPDAVHIRCAHEWIDSQGQPHVVSMTVDPGSTPPFDPGSIKGNAWVKNGSEDSTRAMGHINVTAFDAVTGDTAVVGGTQITNNTNSDTGGPTDTLTAGGFEVTFSGPLYDDLTGQVINPNATMTCSTAHQPLPQFVFPGGANFESFFGLDTDGDGTS